MKTSLTRGEEMGTANRQMSLNELERAERMADKWNARAEAYWYGGDGQGIRTSGYCKTDEDAETAGRLADRIRKTAAKASYGTASKSELALLRWAIDERSRLDALLTLARELAQSQKPGGGVNRQK